MISLHIDEQSGWRGGEQQASYLVHGLAARGHTVLIAGRPGSPFMTHQHEAPGLIRIKAPFLGEFDAYTIWKLARAIRRYNVDIIHGHTGHAHFYASMARLLARKGLVIASRRVDFVPSQNYITRWKYAQPDHFIAVSDCVAQVLLAYGIEPSRVTVVHSAQDAVRLDTPPVSRESIGVPEHAPLLVCVAALVGHKDHKTLISAMPVLLRAFPDAHLALVGEGGLRPEIEAQIAALGLASHVTLLGYREDVISIMRAADVFVLPSKMEGLGSAIIEAMMCRIPVVACASGGIPETVMHETTGLLAPPEQPQALAETLIRLLTDHALAGQLVCQAYDFVTQQRSADAMVENTLRVYERLLGVSMPSQ